MLERDLAHRVDVRLRAFGTDVLVNKSAHVRLAASRDMVGTCAQELGGRWEAMVLAESERGGGRWWCVRGRGGASEGGGVGGQRKGEEKGRCARRLVGDADAVSRRSR